MIAVVNRLDRYWSTELGCTPAALYNGGISLWSPLHRGGPRWMGWLVPLEVIVLDRATPGTGVISVTPSLQPALQQAYDPTCSAEEYLPPNGTALCKFIRANLAHHTPKIHRILSCDAETFVPASDALPVTQLHEDDPHIEWFRMHFDGPIFAARDERGAIASWAAIKCKSDDVWEMAVMTEPTYRNRGLARSVTSHATQAAIESGKLALYLHEVSNHASAKVCHALGYTPYGYELTCETGRVNQRRRR